MDNQIKPKYFPLIQKAMLCNVTCLQMILLRRNLGLLSQEDMAYEMRMTIPEEHLHIFSKPFEPADEKWTKNFYLELAEERLNKLFDNHKLSLKAKVYFKSEIKDVKEFIIDNLKKGNDIWAMIAIMPIYGTKEGGHDILIQSINIETNKVIIVDPSGTQKQVREIKLEKLFDAMDKKYGRERGFVVISDNNG